MASTEKVTELVTEVLYHYDVHLLKDTELVVEVLYHYDVHLEKLPLFVVEVLSSVPPVKRSNQQITGGDL